MSDVPFTWTPEAAALLRARMRFEKQVLDVRDKLPVLRVILGTTHADKDGRILFRCRVSQFGVGWYRADQVADHCLEEVDLGGEMIYAFADTMNRLKGKTLVVESVGIGYPDPATKLVQVVTAR